MERKCSCGNFFDVRECNGICPECTKDIFNQSTQDNNVSKKTNNLDMKIKSISKIIHQNNVEKGFWENKETKNVGEVLMLCVSELSEALEAHRKGRFADVQQLQKNIALGGEWEANFKAHIKDTFEDEIADTVIRLFDLCEAFNIDLETHILLKHRFNTTRPYKHGKKY